MLYGEINMGEVSSVVRGECNCFGWIKSMGVAESEMTDMHHVSAK